MFHTDRTFTEFACLYFVQLILNRTLLVGLFICAEIIEKHGGTMGVKSEPGHGCKFWFTLPL
ncbi:MAG: ATP-binding protein [Mucilaginibacter sp.]